MRARLTALALAGAGILPTTAAPLAADRMPLAAGGWIETLGPWRVDGPRVIFLSREGNLRSLPRAELAAAAAELPPAGLGELVAEYPRGEPVAIPDPAEPPPEPSRLRRATTTPPDPVCILANPRPGAAPEVRCVRPLGRRGPVPRARTARR